MIAEVRCSSPDAYKLMHEGTLALAKVEAAGMRVDLEYVDEALRRSDRKIKKLTQKLKKDEVWRIWRRRYGEKTNLDSMDQLSHVLFDEMKLTPREGTLTASGKRYRVDSDCIEDYKRDHPFLDIYSRIAKLRKGVGTFLAGIRRNVGNDGRLHAFHNLNLARTYRGSSDGPNVQNFPIRNPELAELIRRAFIPSLGCVIVELDFSGIEVRVAACYHHDPMMLRYLKDKSKDMHRDMAMQCYLIDDPRDVNGPVRHCGKNQFVFPQFYGSVAQNCAPAMWRSITRQDLVLGCDKDGKKPDPNGKSLIKHLKKHGITELGKCEFGQKEKPGKHTFVRHIMDVEQDFWNKRFKVYQQWKNNWYDKYLSRGWFKTYTGFIISGVLKRTDVINYPIQGPAFHCLLWSLIEIQKRMERKGLKSKIINTIHDSIIGDVRIDELEQFVEIAVDVMTNRLLKHWSWITVPIEVEVEVAPPGKSWFEKKKYEVAL